MRKILKEQIKIKDHLSPAEAETGTELGNTMVTKLLNISKENIFDDEILCTISD